MTTTQPNTSLIRDALNKAFDDVELGALCSDYFPSIKDKKFSVGMRKDQKIGLLLDHCRRAPSGFSSLLAAVRQEYELSDGKRGELTPLIGVLEAYLSLSAPPKVSEEPDVDGSHVTKEDVLRVLYQAYRREPFEKVSSEKIRRELALSRDEMNDILLALKERGFIQLAVVGHRALLSITADGVTVLK